MIEQILGLSGLPGHLLGDFPEAACSVPLFLCTVGRWGQLETRKQFSSVQTTE